MPQITSNKNPPKIFRSTVPTIRLPPAFKPDVLPLNPFFPPYDFSKKKNHPFNLSLGSAVEYLRVFL